MAKLHLFSIISLTAITVWVLSSQFFHLRLHRILSSTDILVSSLSSTMQLSATTARKPFTLNSSDFSVQGSTDPFQASWNIRQSAPHVLIVDLSFTAAVPAKPPPSTFMWKVPSLDIDGVWTPKTDLDKSTFWEHTVDARASIFAPVLSLRTNTGHSRITFAVADALNRTRLSAHIREEDVAFELKVVLFAEPLPLMTHYATQIRIDLRDVPLTSALADVSKWWAGLPGYTPAPVPRAALAPVYSTWYNFHQLLDVTEILAELDLAKSLGYRTLILDDGWQTLDSHRGYAYTGDWRADRIPNMRAFVDAVHAKGMHFILWYSVPFMGEKASRMNDFSGMFLKKSVELGAYVLDPRYPHVREYLISTYETALVDWDLDGFKLDFIDDFFAVPGTPLTLENGRDFASVNAAVDRLLTDVISRLRARKPNILIEFRQRYIGPLMRSYGNMFRACDCPNNADVNRARIVDLRLLSGNTAVHSDMLMWHRDESVEHAALQVLSALFAVPQVSVRLNQLPAAHMGMLRFWTAYWIENEELLMHGVFTPSDYTAVYPLITSASEKKTIVALYADRVVEMGNTQSFDVINAKASSLVLLRVTQGFGRVHLSVRNTLGEQVSSRKDVISAGIREIDVPPSGLVEVRKVTS